jgi:hypothetical protein
MVIVINSIWRDSPSTIISRRTPPFDDTKLPQKTADVTTQCIILFHVAFSYSSSIRTITLRLRVSQNICDKPWPTQVVADWIELDLSASLHTNSEVVVDRKRHSPGAIRLEYLRCLKPKRMEAISTRPI